MQSTVHSLYEKYNSNSLAPARDMRNINGGCMTHLLRVEEEGVFCQHYRDMLSHDPSFVMVANVGTGGEGLAKLDLRKPDVLLVDLGLPDVSGHRRHCIRRRRTCAGVDRSGAAGCFLKVATEESSTAGIR